VSNYLVNLARRAAGGGFPAVEPPVRPTFLPGDASPGDTAERSYRYPPAFEASTVGRGREMSGDPGHRGTSHRRTRASHRLTPVSRNELHTRLGRTADSESPHTLPEGVTVIRSISTDYAGRPANESLEPSGSVGRSEPVSDQESDRASSTPSGSERFQPFHEPGGRGDRSASELQREPPGASLEASESIDEIEISPARSQFPPVDSGLSSASSSTTESLGSGRGSVPDPSEKGVGESPSQRPGAEPVAPDSTGQSIFEPANPNPAGSPTSGDVQKDRPQPLDEPTVQIEPADSMSRGTSRRQNRSSRSGRVEVHIGTIELRASETNVREGSGSAPDQSVQPKGFDEYRSQRRYET
jgi:hypothetical protein